MNIHQLQQFIRDNLDLTEEVISVFERRCADPAVGEAICLYIAGLSAGARQYPITRDHAETLATAWQMASPISGVMLPSAARDTTSSPQRSNHQ